MNSGIKRAAILRAAAAGVLALSGAAFAVDTVFVGPTGGTWDDDNNWRQGGADLTLGNGDDVFIQPGTTDAAIIRDGFTVNLSTTETVLETQVSHAANVFDTSTTHGVARLNILPGAVLTTNGNSSGIRLGRALDAGQAIGTSRGEIIQTGGSVIIQQGSNGLRLSQSDSGNVGDSLYRISGGSVRGGAGADGTMVSNLALGAITNTWGQAEFHVVGSAPTSIRFADIQLGANNAGGSGDAILHFSLDANGVTPIVAEDELQFRGTNPNVFGNNLLKVDLIGEAPTTDIVLIQADRLNTQGATSGPANEHFTNYLEGDPVTADFGIHRYNWTIDYTDGSSGGPTIDVVKLLFVSKTLIPSSTFYWDINSTNAGAGGAAPAGNWDGSAQNFNTDSAGGAGTLSAAPGASDTVVFAAGNDATGAYTVTVSGARSAAMVKIEEGSVTLTGGTIATPAFDVASGAAGTIASQVLGGPTGSVTKTGPGTLTITSTNTYTGGTTVEAGTLVVNRLHGLIADGTGTPNPVSITGGTLKIAESSPTIASGHPGGNNAFVSRPGSMITITHNNGDIVSLNPTTLTPRVYNGTLDLTNNDLVIDYSGASPIADVEDMIRAGRNGGAWNGKGIISSTAGSIAAAGAYTLGVIDNATPGITPFTTFSDQTVDTTTVLVKFVHRSDINMDGVVTFSDSVRFNGNYSEGTPTRWVFGDLNYNGVSDFGDSVLFNGGYDEALASLPEPGLGSAIAGLAALTLRRRRAVRAQ